MKDIELNIIKISINILKLQKTIRHNLTIKHYYFKSLFCVCCLGEPTLFTHIILKSDWCPSLRSRVTDSEDVHCLLPLCLSPQLKSWGQEAAMRYGRRAWNAWPRVARCPTHAPSATVACLRVRVTGWIQSGQAEQRSRLSASDTRRRGPTCACQFHEDSGFTRRLVCAHALSSRRNVSALHLSSPGHLAPVPPPVLASWKSPCTTGSVRFLPVHSDNYHPAARATVSILKHKNRTISILGI